MSAPRAIGGYIMRKILLVASICAVALISLPSSATAITITFSRSTSISGNLDRATVARFDGGGGIITISCTSHFIELTVRNLAGPSPNTSILLSATLNRYTGCTYTSAGASGTAVVLIRCDWLLTFVDTRTGTITFTGSPCIDITFSTGLIRGCSISLGRQSLPFTITSHTSPTTGISLTENRVSVAYTTNGRCAGDAGGIWNQTQTITISTVGLSAP
jgi:hypothetical protein